MREQPWMRHVTHQMTKLILVHKDACKSRLVLNSSQAKRVECAVRAVIKLYCTDVSCEWVSCPHTPRVLTALLRLEVEPQQPVHVDCILHVTHLCVGSQHGCRLDQQMMSKSSRNALQRDLRRLTEKSSPQRTNLTNEFCAFLYPTQTLHLPRDTSLSSSHQALSCRTMPLHLAAHTLFSATCRPFH